MKPLRWLIVLKLFGGGLIGRFKKNFESSHSTALGPKRDYVRKTDLCCCKKMCLQKCRHNLRSHMKKGLKCIEVLIIAPLSAIVGILCLFIIMIIGVVTIFSPLRTFCLLSIISLFWFVFSDNVAASSGWSFPFVSVYVRIYTLMAFFSNLTLLFFFRAGPYWNSRATCRIVW